MPLDQRAALSDAVTGHPGQATAYRSKPPSPPERFDEDIKHVAFEMVNAFGRDSSAGD